MTVNICGRNKMEFPENCYHFLNQYEEHTWYTLWIVSVFYFSYDISVTQIFVFRNYEGISINVYCEWNCLMKDVSCSWESHFELITFESGQWVCQLMTPMVKRIVNHEVDSKEIRTRIHQCKT